jgi:hypothetical protein
MREVKLCNDENLKAGFKNGSPEVDCREQSFSTEEEARDYIVSLGGKLQYEYAPVKECRDCFEYIIIKCSGMEEYKYSDKIDPIYLICPPPHV